MELRIRRDSHVVAGLPVMEKGMAGAEGLPDMHELWIKLNRPSAERFRQALVKRGMVAPSVKHIRELFLKYQSSKQLFAPPPKSTGHVYSTHLDSRWQADVMLYSHTAM